MFLLSNFKNSCNLSIFTEQTMQYENYKIFHLRKSSYSTQVIWNHLLDIVTRLPSPRGGKRKAERKQDNRFYTSFIFLKTKRAKVCKNIITRIFLKDINILQRQEYYKINFYPSKQYYTQRDLLFDHVRKFLLATIQETRR